MLAGALLLTDETECVIIECSGPSPNRLSEKGGEFLI